MPRLHPPGLGGPDRELAHELTEPGTVGMRAGIHLEHRHRGGGHLLPVDIELTRMRVQEHETGLVLLEGGQGREVGDQQRGSPVLPQDVEAASQHERGPGDGLERIQQRALRRVQPLRRATAAAPDRSRPGEGVQMRALCVIESQGLGDGVEDLGRGASTAALLRPGLVVDADPREHRQLLTAQPLDPPEPLTDHTDLVGGDARTRGAQEVGEPWFLVIGLTPSFRAPRPMTRPRGVPRVF